jgi:ech hydrogenase subunit B
MDLLIKILSVIGIIVVSPLVGGFLAGLDRKITARLQGRKGPSVWQAFYDFRKLWNKETLSANKVQRYYVYLSLVFIVFTTVIICMGGDILLAIFALTLGSIMFVLGGYSSNSPYSNVGSLRELLQMMAYEPMVLLVAVGMYYSCGSFEISDIVSADKPAVVYLPGILIGFVYILTFKLRKSPFDFSMSHHGHQEIVKGITTEYSGKDLAIIELTHWYETIIALSLVYIFVAYSNPLSIVYGVLAAFAAYLIEIFIDNGCARVTWQKALSSAWYVTLIFGGFNLVALALIRLA